MLEAVVGKKIDDNKFYILYRQNGITHFGEMVDIQDSMVKFHDYTSRETVDIWFHRSGGYLN